jgi:aspartate racemase
MKTIGMLGGMSWESTATYYQLINDGVKSQLGGLHSAKMVLHSVDFAEIELLQRQADWPAMATLLGGAAKKLQSAGADFFMICTNTMHKIAPEICAKVDIPLLHIADTTAVQLIEDNVGRVGLLGTRFTMDDGFYQSHLFDKYGIEVLVPEEAQKASVHEIIYRELCQGQFLEASRKVYLDVIERLVQQGAQAVILGCTEIALLIQQTHTQIPLYDTTDIHARAAVSLILDNNE